MFLYHDILLLLENLYLVWTISINWYIPLSWYSTTTWKLVFSVNYIFLYTDILLLLENLYLVWTVSINWYIPLYWYSTTTWKLVFSVNWITLLFYLFKTAVAYLLKFLLLVYLLLPGAQVCLQTNPIIWYSLQGVPWNIGIKRRLENLLI